jgi:hypothetical protein
MEFKSACWLFLPPFGHPHNISPTFALIRNRERWSRRGRATGSDAFAESLSPLPRKFRFCETGLDRYCVARVKVGLRVFGRACNAYRLKLAQVIVGNKMLSDRDKILNALREKPHKVFEVMKRANISNQEACQSLLLKMRDEGSVKFDIHKGQWLIA